MPKSFEACFWIVNLRTNIIKLNKFYAEPNLQLLMKTIKHDFLSKYYCNFSRM